MVERGADRSLRLDAANQAGYLCNGQVHTHPVGQRLDHNHSTAIRGYGSYSQLALLHPAAVLAQALFPPEGGNINPSRFGLSPPTGYNLFTLQAVEFTPQPAAGGRGNGELSMAFVTGADTGIDQETKGWKFAVGSGILGWVLDGFYFFG